MGDGGVGVSGLPAPTVTTPVPQPTGAVGGLKVVNWAGFKAALSLNFDDSNSSQISNYSALEALGVHFTFFMIGNKVSTQLSSWKQAVADGHEMGNHTYDHTSTEPTGTTAAVQAAIQSDVDMGASTVLSDLGVKTYSFAEPNGDSWWITPAASVNFLSRGVADGLMMPGNETSPSWQNTYCFLINNATTANPPLTAAQETSTFNSEIDGARSGGGWRVILVHGFTGGTDGAYEPIILSAYVASVTYAKGFPDLWIDTMLNVGAYWRGQNAFQAATPTTSGTTTTYAWTLPANFPPGKYLRVTVTGGHVSQNGQQLAWDTHGYYEISLDEGSLTVGP